MKRLRTLINTLIIGSILVILYSIVGHNYVRFYYGGKTEILEIATVINELCGSNRSCPLAIDGWQALHGNRDGLRKGSMFYFPAPGEGNKESGQSKKHQEFTLVYSFFEPDHWFEVQGGVDKKVTSGWKSR